jgi:hypothetical protein
MPLPASRSVVIISGLLTLLVLGGGTLAVGFHNGWLRTASDSPSRETAAASAQPTPTGSDRDAVARLTEPSPAPSTQGAIQDEVGAYRQKLEEAYRALDDAYAQIRALQSPQPQLASARNEDERFREHNGDDDRRGRRSDRRRSHDD